MSFDTATTTALASGALPIVDFITLHGIVSGSAHEFDFWTGVGNATVSVISAEDGSTDSRDYVGDGALPTDGIPAIVDGIGLEAKTHSVGLSALHASILDMIAGSGNAIRTAKVEIQRGYRDPATWKLVSTPYPIFLGRVDGLGQATPASGEDGMPVETTMTLDVVSDLIDLTKTNPALKSDEQQRLRSGDRTHQYADTAGKYPVWWGQTRGAA